MICPKCKKEINYLMEATPGMMIHYLQLDSQGDPQYISGEFETEEPESTYYCPRCGRILPMNEAEAIAFIKGDNTNDNKNVQ